MDDVGTKAQGCRQGGGSQEAGRVQILRREEPTGMLRAKGNGMRVIVKSEIARPAG